MARGRRITRWLVTLALLPGACRTAQEAPTPDPAPTPAQVDLEAARLRFEALVAAHNARATKLGTLESRASLELRYSDADGDHFDQCEADVFLAPGGRGALRATKVGKNLLWVGSDGTRGWIFRLDQEPTSLTVFEDIGRLTPGQRMSGEGAAEYSLLAPSAVRTIAGLAPIGEGFTLRSIEGSAGDGSVESRFEVVSTLSSQADAVIQFAKTGLPGRVRIERHAGAAILTAELSEYVPAQVENLAQGAWPQVPRRVVVTGEAAAGGKAAEARLYLDAPIAMPKRMKPRFFVLDDLVAQLRPDTVEHVVATDGADGGR